MLGVAPGIMPDVGDVVDIHGEQRELSGNRPPAEVSPGGRCVTPLYLMSGLGADGTAHHERRPHPGREQLGL